MNAQEAAKKVNSGMNNLSLAELMEVYAVLKTDENSAGLFKLVNGFAKGQLSSYARSSADFQAHMSLEEAGALRELAEEVGFDANDNLTADEFYGLEEIWMDPSRLLTLARNIKNGLNEYINNYYLKQEIENNFNTLKNNLDKLSSKFYDLTKNADTGTMMAKANKNHVVACWAVLRLIANFFIRVGIAVPKVDSINEPANVANNISVNNIPL